VEGLYKSKLDSIKLLSISSNKILKLPILKMEKLEVLNATKNCI
jgi:Leucine-rich repeat (LRR) protein